MKRRKWYSAITHKPDVSYNLIAMTDMGYSIRMGIVKNIYTL